MSPWGLEILLGSASLWIRGCLGRLWRVSILNQLLKSLWIVSLTFKRLLLHQVCRLSSPRAIHILKVNLICLVCLMTWHLRTRATLWPALCFRWLKYLLLFWTALPSGWPSLLRRWCGLILTRCLISGSSAGFLRLIQDDFRMSWEKHITCWHLRRLLRLSCLRIWSWLHIVTVLHWRHLRRLHDLLGSLLVAWSDVYWWPQSWDISTAWLAS